MLNAGRYPLKRVDRQSGIDASGCKRDAGVHMVEEEFDALLNTNLPFAQDMLAKHGEFFPFGACADVKGAIALHGGWTGDERPAPQEVIDLMVGGLRSQAQQGEIRASAIFIDARAVPPGKTEKTDAILVRMEHRDGDPVDLFVPYRKSPDGQYEYGEPFLYRGEPQVFLPAAPCER